MATTQAALGRALLDLTREAPEAAARVVTVSPDVSSSTNLGGWVNKVGVWSAHERTDWFADDAETILHWREKPTGQHIELGIAETNLVGLIGELGATWSRWGQPLFPIGVLYDPFVERALEPWSFGIYAGGQSILVGTPSGVTPRPRRRRAPVDHHPVHRDRAAGLRQLRARLRHRHRMVPAGQPGPAGQARTAAPPTCGCPPVRSARSWPPCPLIRPPGNAAAARSWPAPTRCAARPSGRAPSPRWARSYPRPWPPPSASRRPGAPADVVCVTSPGPAVPGPARPPGPSRDRASPGSWTRRSPRPAPRRWSPCWMGTRTRWPSWPPSTRCRAALGVAQFGQSGSIEDLYRYNGIDTDSIIRAALDLAPYPPPAPRGSCPQAAR